MLFNLTLTSVAEITPVTNTASTAEAVTSTESASVKSMNVPIIASVAEPVPTATKNSVSSTGNVTGTKVVDV